MIKRNMIEVKIPFSGFYNSIWSELIDNNEQSDLEHYSEEWELSNDASMELGEWMYSNNDYSKLQDDIAREYASQFVGLLADKIGVGSIPYEYSEMTSPREYNFETDKIYIQLPLKALKMVLSLPEVQGKLAEVVKERHSSCDGFCSFYSNSLDSGEWANPVPDWDHNQWETVFWAMFDSVDYRGHECSEYNEWCWEVYEGMSGNGYGLPTCDPEQWYKDYQESQELSTDHYNALQAQILGKVKPECPSFVIADLLGEVVQSTESIEIPYFWALSGQYETIEVAS